MLLALRGGPGRADVPPMETQPEPLPGLYCNEVVWTDSATIRRRLCHAGEGQDRYGVSVGGEAVRRRGVGVLGENLQRGLGNRVGRWRVGQASRHRYWRPDPRILQAVTKSGFGNGPPRPVATRSARPSAAEARTSGSVSLGEDDQYARVLRVHSAAGNAMAGCHRFSSVFSLPLSEPLIPNVPACASVISCRSLCAST